MKLPELRQWRSVKDDGYLKMTRDHLQIAGWNQSAAIVYAVLEFKAHPGGKDALTTVWRERTGTDIFVIPRP